VNSKQIKYVYGIDRVSWLYSGILAVLWNNNGPL